MTTRSFRILGAAMAALLPACGGGHSSGGAPGNPAFPVTVQEPSAGQTYTAPATISLSAVAADPAGVAKVEFLQDVAPGGETHWIGGSVVATLTQPPFQAASTDVPPGIHTFVARSTDTLGAQTFSNSVTISVLPPGASPAGWVPIARVYGPPSGMWFVDANRGWIVGDGGVILHTVDGGATWVQQSSGTLERINKVQFVDAQRGWATVGFDGTVLRTTDGGATWIPSFTGSAGALSFVDSDRGWVVGGPQVGGGAGEKVFATQDGGVTWTPLPTGIPGDVAFFAVRFVDRLNGWLLGLIRDGVTEFHEAVLRTTDGGLTWTEQFRAGPDESLRAMDFVNATTGWVSRSRTSAQNFSLNHGILFTSDGGATWTVQTYFERDSIGTLDFVSPTQGWGGGPGMIIHTEDGGGSWATQPLGAIGLFTNPSIDSITEVRFIDANRGWALCGNGLLLKTTTGGKGP